MNKVKMGKKGGKRTESKKKREREAEKVFLLNKVFKLDDV